MTVEEIEIIVTAKIEEALKAGADYAGDEEYINKIQGGWLDFDLVIATPDMMPKLGKLGKLLGTKGLMPNPKSGTVTTDVAKTVDEFKKGKLAFKVDKLGSIHVPIGKVDFDKVKIQNQNYCPFRFSLNQLWRNMLLAEKVAEVRELDELHFWVISPKENTFLWQNKGQNNETAFREILTSKGNEKFKSLELDKHFISKIENYANDKWSKDWLRKFREKYLTKTD